jgi:hypothetical protein
MSSPLMLFWMLSQMTKRWPHSYWHVTALHYILSANKNIIKIKNKWTHTMPHVHRTDKPERPENLRAENVDKDSLTLVWSPPTDDDGSIKKYIVEKRRKVTFYLFFFFKTHMKRCSFHWGQYIYVQFTIKKKNINLGFTEVSTFMFNVLQICVNSGSAYGFIIMTCIGFLLLLHYFFFIQCPTIHPFIHPSHLSVHPSVRTSIHL